MRSAAAKHGRARRHQRRSCRFRATGSQAIPMTYRMPGRQMVVVAAGGHGPFGTTSGDSVLAYELK
ncbi:hypothetical protein E5678_04690 [Hydrogenophaga sp. PAMC20947]|nr:hypothetical protein E5678_04690 [Hydrogenophaga sp. PAMC20947]